MDKGTAEGRIRTGTGISAQRFLRPSRLPFRHFGESSVSLRLLARGCVGNLYPVQAGHSDLAGAAPHTRICLDTARGCS